MGSEWVAVTLGELSLDVSYGYTESATQEEIGPHFLRITDIQNGVVDWSTVPYCPIDDQKLGKYLLDKGDIVVARTGNSTGENYIFTGEKDTVFASYLIRFKIDKTKADPFYVWYNMRSPKWWEYVNSSKTGSAQAGANAKLLGLFPLTLPSLEEQKEIARILAALDDKIELNRQINATLESMAQALFKSWFVDFDPVIDNALAAGNAIPDALQSRAEKRKALHQQAGSADEASPLQPLPADIRALFPDSFVFNEEMGWVPEGWKPTALGCVSVCHDSKRIPLSKRQREEKKPGSVPYYGATSVMDQINEYIFDDIYLLVGEDGSVIKEDGTPFTQYIWGPSWVNNHAHVLQGKEGVSTEHLMLFMQQQNMSPYVTGAVQLKINQKNLNSIPFIKAPDEVNAHFAKTISPYYAKIRSCYDQIETLSQLRDSLLPRLLSGQIEIPEAAEMAAEAV